MSVGNGCSVISGKLGGGVGLIVGFGVGASKEIGFFRGE